MPSVLVVDDSSFMLNTLSNMFSQWGFDIVGKATNGQEAVELYKQFQPDLVTMDMTMPIMTGLEAAKEILSESPEAKIIMVTALRQQRLVIEALELGVKDFITKPFEPEQLKDMVHKVMST